jgi:hypothetical protein
VRSPRPAARLRPTSFRVGTQLQGSWRSSRPSKSRRNSFLRQG